jgi:hypothetical protein
MSQSEGYQGSLAGSGGMPAQHNARIVRQMAVRTFLLKGRRIPANFTLKAFGTFLDRMVERSLALLKDHRILASISPKTLGTFLGVMTERSLDLLKDARILAKFWRTSSIRGRIAESSRVIEPIKSSMNSKPWYF